MITTTIRLPKELHQAIKESAKRNLRSLNNELIHALLYYLKHAPEASENFKEEPEK